MLFYIKNQEESPEALGWGNTLLIMGKARKALASHVTGPYGDTLTDQPCFLP